MRITTLLFTLPFAAVVATAGCVRTATNPATGETDVDVELPTKQGEDWSGKLAGQGVYANLTGSTQAMVVEGRTTVTVRLDNAAAGAVHPWHVHEGACGSGGPIVGDPSAYSPLIVGDDGHAAGHAQLSLGLDEAKDYFVNIHASPTDLATIIACGDLDD